MAEASSSGASLTVRGGPFDGRTADLDASSDEALIGSDPGCWLALDLPGVSPIHARVWMDAAGVNVSDTRSARGLFVNDTRVTEPAALRNGDILWLGPPGDADSVMLQCR